MTRIDPDYGISTIVNHFAEGENAHNAHITPIYQTSTFGFPDVESGGRIFIGEEPGYTYTRGGNPNTKQLAQKYAYLEGLDLIRQRPNTPPAEIVAGEVTASGMAAITSAVLARVRAGQTVVAQRHLYGNAYRFFNELAPRFGIQVAWVDDLSAEGWEAVLAANPDAVLAYAETPANPTLVIVDLSVVVEIAHAYGAWVMVDNTFATPYHQRPLNLGCDVVVHSTTKYLTGHGVVVGGVIISPHLDFMTTKQDGVGRMTYLLGPAVSPFDAWLANIGLKTFEVRMQRHAENGLAVARWLEGNPKVGRVDYPGLENHLGHEIAAKQMHNGFGGMVSFELKGGYDAGVTVMNNVQLASLAVSLGNVDSLIQHPASMTHRGVPREECLKVGVTEGLIRFSVGIENIDDMIGDLDQAIAKA